MFFHYSWVGLYQRLNIFDGPLIEILRYFALTNLYLVSYHLYIISSERRIPQTTQSSQSEKRLTTERVLSTLANEIARDAIGGIRKTQSASSSPNISMFNSAPTSAPLTYKLGKPFYHHSICLHKNKLYELIIAIIFLPLSLNTCFGCSKEPSH